LHKNKKTEQDQASLNAIHMIYPSSIAFHLELVSVQPIHLQGNEIEMKADQEKETDKKNQEENRNPIEVCGRQKPTN